MTLHPNEIILKKLTDDERMMLELVAADLGKGHVRALEEQKKRQERSI